MLENDIENDLESDLNEKQYSEENAGIPNIQYLGAKNNIPIIEAGTPTEFIGPKRRDLYSQILFQTEFVQWDLKIMFVCCLLTIGVNKANYNISIPAQGCPC